MANRKTRKNRLEPLESRHLLAAVVEGGDLVVDPESSEIAIVDLGDGTLEVTETGAAEDGTDLVTIVEGVEDDIIIRTSEESADNISLDLSAGSVAVDDVRVAASDGDNVFALIGGTIDGDLRYRGGGGTDSLNIGQDVQIGGHLSARLGDGSNTVELAGQVDGGVFVRGGSDDDTIALLAESLVGRGVKLSLGEGTNSTNLDGTIDGRLGYRGGDDNDLVTLGSESTIGDDTRLRLGEGENQVMVDGLIGGDLAIQSTNEDDVVEISDDAEIVGDTDLGLGEQTEEESRRGRRRGRGIGRGFFGRGRR
ncbi:MAG: hypothetical protein AAFX06_27125 [Planctomycetota bacterium]